MSEQRYLYLVESTIEASWDELNGIVVYAKDAREARTVAGRAHGDEGEEYWLSKDVRVKRLPAIRNVNKPFVVLRDFHSG